mmetsp:Transcript_21716/g.53158  ORF Transcript_21716/g.53158 Transcript_21716/m.53158 type:complete len:144 (+) Transcript_21716:367-798(+)
MLGGVLLDNEALSCVMLLLLLSPSNSQTLPRLSKRLRSMPKAPFGRAPLLEYNGERESFDPTSDIARRVDRRADADGDGERQGGVFAGVFLSGTFTPRTPLRKEKDSECAWEKGRRSFEEMAPADGIPAFSMARLFRVEEAWE